MCTCGGPPDINDVKSLEAKDYVCQDCGNKFKGLGSKPKCPSCMSKNVELR